MNNNLSAGSPPSSWQYYCGWLFFILGCVMPFLTPLVPMLGFNKAMTTILIGVFLVGGPELVMMLAIALWGRATFNYFMGQIYKVLKRFAPATKVSPGRYYFGLVIFITSFLPSWFIAYVPNLVSDGYRVSIVLGFDILFLISFFILGGDFWEKIRALFTPEPIKILKKESV